MTRERRPNLTDHVMVFMLYCSLQCAHKYLVSKGQSPSDAGQFKRQLYDIWFRLYHRDRSGGWVFQKKLKGLWSFCDVATSALRAYHADQYVCWNSEGQLLTTSIHLWCCLSSTCHRIESWRITGWPRNESDRIPGSLVPCSWFSKSGDR